MFDDSFLQQAALSGADPTNLALDPNTGNGGPVSAPYNVIQVKNGGVVLALMDPDDPSYSADIAVAEAQVQGNPGMVAIVAHGNPVTVGESSSYQAMPQTVAATIKTLPVWKSGQLSKVVFDSCYTGALPQSGSATPFNLSQAWTTQTGDLSMAALTQQDLSAAAQIAAATNPAFNTTINVKAPNNYLWPSLAPSGTSGIPSDYVNIPNSNDSYFIGPAANNNNPLNPAPGVPLVADPNPADAGQWNYFGTNSGW